MLICAFDEDGQRHNGLIEGDAVYYLESELFEPPRRGSRVGLLEDIILVSPVKAGKIICVGRNYAAHAAERGEEVPEEPLIFLKPPSTIIGPHQAIELLPDMGSVHHEAELAVVIGKQGRFIPQTEALSYVLGFTCTNDVSARDYQARDGQWTRAKGFDTFCPLGPWITTELDTTDLRVTCHVNGEQRQSERTSHMTFKVADIIAHISGIMTLEPGDVILTGTPAGVGPLVPGDEVVVEVEGIGALRNTVKLRE